MPISCCWYELLALIPNSCYQDPASVTRSAKSGQVPLLSSKSGDAEAGSGDEVSIFMVLVLLIYHSQESSLKDAIIGRLESAGNIYHNPR